MILGLKNPIVLANASNNKIALSNKTQNAIALSDAIMAIARLMYLKVRSPV